MEDQRPGNTGTTVFNEQAPCPHYVDRLRLYHPLQVSETADPGIRRFVSPLFCVVTPYGDTRPFLMNAL
jgi:hypothetical protein